MSRGEEEAGLPAGTAAPFEVIDDVGRNESEVI